MRESNGRMTAPAKTGPAQQPQPTSSTPATIVKPREQLALFLERREGDGRHMTTFCPPRRAPSSSDFPAT
jgi:hypothetical protein